MNHIADIMSFLSAESHENNTDDIDEPKAGKNLIKS